MKTYKKKFSEVQKTLVPWSLDIDEVELDDEPSSEEFAKDIVNYIVSNKQVKASEKQYKFVIEKLLKEALKEGVSIYGKNFDISDVKHEIIEGLASETIWDVDLAHIALTNTI